MRCKEVEKMIPFFLEDDLDTDDLRDFVEHIDHCDNCKEELTIQFLVSEGMARLESGNVFDLQNELDTYIDNAYHTLKMRESFIWFLFGAMGLVFVAFISLMALIFFL